LLNTYHRDFTTVRRPIGRCHCVRLFCCKKRLSSVLRATEYLFLENIALKLLLEHRQVANWQKLLDHLLLDKEIMAGVRLKFSDLYRKLEMSKDPSSVLDVFWGALPAANKPH
jgi:hypothetical protein